MSTPLDEDFANLFRRLWIALGGDPPPSWPEFADLEDVSLVDSALAAKGAMRHPIIEALGDWDNVGQHLNLTQEQIASGFINQTSPVFAKVLADFELAKAAYLAIQQLPR